MKRNRIFKQEHTVWIWETAAYKSAARKFGGAQEASKSCDLVDILKSQKFLLFGSGLYSLM